MSKSSLCVVGTGIKFLSHMSIETQTEILSADLVLYLVNNPAMKVWIEKNAKQSESLDTLYLSDTSRKVSYDAITDYILESLNDDRNVVVVMYGHPTVFSMPALEAVKRAINLNIPAKVLPAISSEDCLFSDLLIDPGSCGCLSYEATDFLIHKRLCDPRSHLILWQIGVIGLLSHKESQSTLDAQKTLQEYLLQFYSEDHQVTIYSASQFPHFEPNIKSIQLKQFHSQTLSEICTLYIPPEKPSVINNEIAIKLKINPN